MDDPAARSLLGRSLKTMDLEKLGTVSLDKEKLRRLFPDMRPGTYQAINNISLANEMGVGPSTPEVLISKAGEPPNLGRGKPHSAILGIEQILSG